MRAFLCGLFLCGAAPGGLRADVTMDLPPFTYTGKILDGDADNLADTSSSAEIRVRKNGVLLARSSVVKMSGTVCNYSLSVPMTSSSAAASSAAAGDLLSFEIDDGVNVYSFTNGAAAGSPGRVARLDFVAAQDSNGDGVADSYSAMIESLMEFYPELHISGSYNASADYDHDGVSNYHEYLAGTNPFDAADTFKIVAFAPVDGNSDLLSLTFIAGKNRMYSVQESKKMDGKPFEKTTFRKEARTGASERDLYATAVEEDYVKTIYLLKSGNTQLFKMKME